MWILALYCLQILFADASECEIKTAYLKLYELVIGGRSHMAMNYAISDFNDRTMTGVDSMFPTLLSKNCTISLALYNATDTARGSIQSAVAVSMNFYTDHLTIPIILALQYSGLSMAASPVFEAFDFMQLSGFATNPALTDYSHFFRNIASDDIQTKAIIKLCVALGWRQIGIVHMATGYAFLSSLTKWASIYEVTISAWSFLEGDNVTIAEAAESMSESGLFIFLLHMYDTDLEFMIEGLIRHGMIDQDGGWNSLYYFIGYDGWFDSTTISGNSLIQTFLRGAVGTCQSAFRQPFFEFAKLLSTESIRIPQSINTAILETNKLSAKYGTDNINSMLPYGYDQIVVILMAVETYIKEFEDYLSIDTQTYIESIGGMAVFTARFSQILKHNVSFVGITGENSFDKNGDREQGLVAYCNFAYDAEGSFVYNTFGFYMDGQEEPVYALDELMWNPSFTDLPLDYYDLGGDEEKLSEVKIAFYLGGGIVLLLCVLFLAYKTYTFCKEFQAHFGDIDGDDEARTHKEKDRRRLMFSILTDSASMLVGIIDFVTDILSLVAIMTAVTGTYSMTLIIVYFVVSTIASFTSILHLVVSLRSIFENLIEIKTGNILTRDSLKAAKSIVLSSDAFADRKQAKLEARMFNHTRFKLEMLHKAIKSETTNIFVCLTEDVPFFVLNFIAMEQAKASGHATSTIVLVSLLVNCMSMGYKMCIIKEFLSHLQEKTVLIAFIEQISQEAECEKVRSEAASFVSHQRNMSILSRVMPQKSRKSSPIKYDDDDDLMMMMLMMTKSDDDDDDEDTDQSTSP